MQRNVRHCFRGEILPISALWVSTEVSTTTLAERNIGQIANLRCQSSGLPNRGCAITCRWEFAWVDPQSSV